MRSKRESADMSDYVAIDSATPPGGDQYFITGVVIEISDREQFQGDYTQRQRY
jgi:hypothetical protein